MIRVHTLRRRGREKILDEHTERDNARGTAAEKAERRLHRALHAKLEAWAANDAGEEVGRVAKDERGELALTLDREKLEGRSR